MNDSNRPDGFPEHKKITKMKTLAELKAFCETCNVRYELNPKYGTETYNPWTGEWEKPIIGYFFGMNNIAGRKGKSEWNWTWYEMVDIELRDDSLFFFAERYSMVNGKSYKGFNEQWNAEQTMARRMAARA